MATDYISREAAIDAICGFDLKSPEFLDGWSRRLIEAVKKDLTDDLNAIPAADVRPVVLCRDCKHFNPYPGDCTDGGIEGVCKRHNSIGVLVMDEDFCSDAELTAAGFLPMCKNYEEMGGGEDG